jgi:ribulose-5-phosphate 4-epimerase/fuculose-1-phosphate aldolase
VSHYVKFTYQRACADIAPFNTLAELNACRRKLLEQHLMGVDSTGVGFGNLSVRDGVSRNFYITGSATGGSPELTPTDCVRVVAYDFARNWLPYEGAAIPSSVSDVRSREIFVMAGHEGGIVTFGKNLEDAFDVVMRERRESSPCI